MMYFAPIQGFTDYIYRDAHAKHFISIDKYFSPYIQVKNDTILPKYIKDIENRNQNINLVPQILVSNKEEHKIVINFLLDNHYNEVNLNLGCPYPMVYKRGKGSGLLPHPSLIEEILIYHFKNFKTPLSLKIRSGLTDKNDILRLIDIFNSYPIHEIIYHPRSAKQLYKGDIDYKMFGIVQEKLNHPIIYNGDINTKSEYYNLMDRKLITKDVMIGRGLLINPFLAEDIISKKINFNSNKFYTFHNELLNSYIERMDNIGNAINKMQQHWTYWQFNFPTKKRFIKQIKKCKQLEVYKLAVENTLSF